MNSTNNRVDIVVLEGRFTTHSYGEDGKTFMTYSDNRILFEAGVRTVSKIYSYKGTCDWCDKDFDGPAVFIMNKSFHLYPTPIEDMPCYQQYLQTLRALKS